MADGERTTRPAAAATRDRIVDAALELFSERSFEGASTRDIATLAGVSQPSLNYHFRSKDELWRSAVDRVFAELALRLEQRIDGLRGVDEITTAKLVIREFIAFSADRPQLHRLIAQESKREGARITWMVDAHIRPLYETTTAMFQRLADAGAVPPLPPAHLYFILTGAGPTIFQLAPGFRHLTGLDPHRPEVVQAHADAVITLLFGEP
jgi:AcrR family transcriptional regulator